MTDLKTILVGAVLVWALLGIEWGIAAVIVWGCVCIVFDGKPNPKHMPKRYREL